jgi:asparagine N-glycosylation enzyme membrane subunit Stt3
VSPKVRRRLAAGAFFATLVLAPVSALTFAKDEPVTVLILSWLALSLTLADLWATTDVRKQQEGG